MKNKLSDLNNHLFETLERLNDDELVGDELDKEVKRAKAIKNVAEAIIKNGILQLQVIKHIDDQGRSKVDFPEILQIEGKKE